MTNQPPWRGPQDQQPGQQWQPQQGQLWQPQQRQSPVWGQPWQQPGGPQYGPQQPYPGGGPGRRARPPRQRHTARTVVLAIVGAVAELIGQTLGRIPWMNWSGPISPDQLRNICRAAHAGYGGTAGESPLCQHAYAVTTLDFVLNVAGAGLLVTALVLWLHGRRARGVS